ncbi:MAG: sigma-70 family RNA polymerase sigma factor [Planctomycetes bacterium]|nr:sigma-70 family RNA polymerase sigma factor [Planctomycetota bacterium]
MTAAHSGHFADFPASEWSRLARSETPEARREHLERLSRLYWSPIYTYVRRRGFDHDAAKDITQECFLRLCQGEGLPAFDGRSRFRTFLRQIANNVAADYMRKRLSTRRGGRVTFTALQDLDDAAFARLAVHDGSPDDAFDREWARVVAENASTQLLANLTAPRDQRKRKVLEMYLLPRLRLEPNPPTRAQVARQIGCAEDDVQNDLRYLRAMAEPYLRQVVRDTVLSPDEVDAEMREVESKA